jgi:predicted CXXCH cytochrome family protein
MNKTANTLILITVTLLGHGTIVQGASILDSKHNLSISGPGTIKASGESEVCIFCHTPHHARQDIPYLWNRSAQATIYTPYHSSTMFPTIVGQPTGASRLCLSCHDGTIALGAVLSEPLPISFSGASTLSGRSTSLGTDLSDDHPISFNYQNSITLGNTELVAATALTSSVQLDSTGQLQCTACHDPHDNALGKFLVMTNLKSALCLGCHNKTGWLDSHHATCNRTWSGSGVDPWPNSDYLTVADNGCGNCHRPHTAGRHQRLLKQSNEEDNCLVCHSGNVATQSNIKIELDKWFRHPVASYLGVHDAAEDFKASAIVKHVECEDCHNPHQVKNATAVAPYVAGTNIGVQGIDADGAKITNAQNLYEICFKCHADTPNNVITTSTPLLEIIPRLFPQLNTRLEFNTSTTSSHPVIRTTSSPYTPSLKPNYQIAGSNIYCTDCHGSDNSTVGAKGPHGSLYQHLLVESYKTQDGGAYNALTDHALCYKCHNQTTIEGGDLDATGGSAKVFSHGGHLIIQNEGISCATCHDPHGSSGYPNLINFNTSKVTDFSTFIPGTSTTSPACNLTCHGHNHSIPGGTGGGGSR